MRNNKGFSFVELLCVIVVVALVIALIVPTILGQIDRARADTILTEARTVLIAAQGTITVCSALDPTDLQLSEGLTGTVDSVPFPKQTAISKQLNAYLAPDIRLAMTASESEGKVSFTIENGKILKIVYEKIVGGKLRTVTIDGGEASVKSTKVVKKKE